MRHSSGLKKTSFFPKKASRGSCALEVVQLPHSRRPAPSRQSARRVAAALRRRQRQVLRTVMESTAPVAVLRVEAPRRVRRRSEGARVLHGLHAPVREVRVVLELVGVVLQQPELGGRLLLHVLVAQSGRSTARPCAPPSWPGPSSASGCPGPPRPWRPAHGFGSSCRPLSAPARRAWWPGRPSRRSCSAEVPRRPCG